ncbi:hypothetical protein [Sinomicrobium weinanense]|uniref:Uncharacterized protein n=1 Tax=Sinomicrobium weinanense TaxID=2842200 RepID=A0A926PZP5_9FLAO|nr:hypothetical protein [Sinomicrobium weinanense]MBC9794347.1 hypothetical protein [Sinomicrobium weinanense]MBU3124254.1 hypothetical protein [Sinomicrobium weinanense]
MVLNKSTYKSIAASFLVLFGIFLITPAIVTIIEKSADVSIFYSAAEEENHGCTKVVDDRIINSIYDSSFVLSSPLYERAPMEYVEDLYTSYQADQFCPPPELS